MFVLCILYLDYGDEEPFLVLFVHGPADGADGPAQRVEVLPGPLGPVHLVVKLFRHYAFRVCVVQVSQVHCRVPGNRGELYCKYVHNLLSWAKVAFPFSGFSLCGVFHYQKPVGVIPRVSLMFL